MGDYEEDFSEIVKENSSLELENHKLRLALRDLTEAVESEIDLAKRSDAFQTRLVTAYSMLGDR